MPTNDDNRTPHWSQDVLTILITLVALAILYVFWTVCDT